MGNDKLTAGRADEIEIQGDLFDYTEKYNLITSKIHMPARVDAATERRIQETAKRIYRALGCRGFARVDMFLEPGIQRSQHDTRFHLAQPFSQHDAWYRLRLPRPA